MSTCVPNYVLLAVYDNNICIAYIILSICFSFLDQDLKALNIKAIYYNE